MRHKRRMHKNVENEDIKDNESATYGSTFKASILRLKRAGNEQITFICRFVEAFSTCLSEWVSGHNKRHQSCHKSVLEFDVLLVCYSWLSCSLSLCPKWSLHHARYDQSLGLAAFSATSEYFDREAVHKNSEDKYDFNLCAIWSYNFEFVGIPRIGRYYFLKILGTDRYW